MKKVKLFSLALFAMTLISQAHAYKVDGEAGAIAVAVHIRTCKSGGGYADPDNCRAANQGNACTSRQAKVGNTSSSGMVTCYFTTYYN